MSIETELAHLPNEEANKFTYEAIRTQIKFLQGEVLTIVDASIASEQQNKAIKDLMKTKFSERLEYLNDLAYGFKEGEGGATIISTGHPRPEN